MRGLETVSEVYIAQGRQRTSGPYEIVLNPNPRASTLKLGLVDCRCELCCGLDVRVAQDHGGLRGVGRV